MSVCTLPEYIRIINNFSISNIVRATLDNSLSNKNNINIAVNVIHDGGWDYYIE